MVRVKVRSLICEVALDGFVEATVSFENCRGEGEL